MSTMEQSFWCDVNDCPDCLRTDLFQGLCQKHSQEWEGIVKISQQDPQVPEEDPF